MNKKLTVQNANVNNSESQLEELENNNINNKCYFQIRIKIYRLFFAFSTQIFVEILMQFSWKATCHSDNLSRDTSRYQKADDYVVLQIGKWRSPLQVTVDNWHKFVNHGQKATYYVLQPL